MQQRVLGVLRGGGEIWTQLIPRHELFFHQHRGQQVQGLGAAGGTVVDDVGRFVPTWSVSALRRFVFVHVLSLTGRFVFVRLRVFFLVGFAVAVISFAVGGHWSKILEEFVAQQVGHVGKTEMFQQCKEVAIPQRMLKHVQDDVQCTIWIQVEVAHDGHDLSHGP